MAGRPSKPDHIKKAQGTLQPCRVNSAPAVGEPLSVIPDVPASVPELGRGYFTFCCKVLIDLGLLTEQFIPTIERAATWYHIWCANRDKALKDDGVQVSQSGYTAVTAHITNMEKAHKYLVEFEGKFGLDLVSSQKIRMPEGPKKSDYFD